MKVLIVGGGGREHALAWKAARSPQVDTVFVAPGNAGTAAEPKLRNVDIRDTDVPALFRFAEDESVDLTIVGPEAPLVAGIVDSFQDGGLRIFGPTRAAARLEGSKTFTKDFLRRHGIPTAQYRSFTDLNEALQYVHDKACPLVVKADGLAAGKGVVMAESAEQANAAVREMLAGNRFGSAGHRVVIEDWLQGEEASFICMVDGRNVLPMATSQDHKARDDGDRGPNTGGMGAYSPAPVVSPSLQRRIMEQVIEPTVAGLALEGSPYTGFLYAGLMIDSDGTPMVLEYNCRFGDPETQPIMLRLRSDLVELCNLGVDGRLDSAEADWDPRAALGVVMAAGGYPANYRRGDVIEGLPAEQDGAKVFHAGTAEDGERVVTAGGRVLCATALGETVGNAQRRAYELVEQIRWPQAQYRRDIGYRAIARETAQTE